ncbi:glycosyltransferase [Nocardia wallacei]|uniref:glycosyltransferase n=1 Tax=Nocardia wallacei TaxID=480035 RepID=UPI002456A29D|nr:glycosyltransferase family 2 protein [Nocardia wallacei]
MEETNPPIVLSVVIPVLNEAKSITRTLDHLVAQAAVDEIVVVDNGSTDGTRQLVENYSREHPRVVVVTESQRGVARARNTGFDTARGEYIGRTDADTLVSPDWGAVIRRHFDDNPDCAAVTGIATYHDSPVGVLLELGILVQRGLGKLGGRVGNMYGPSMAIRRTAWEKVRGDTSVRPDVVDDLDLAICLFRHGQIIHQLVDMRVRTSSRRRRLSPRRCLQFHRGGLRTARRHEVPIRWPHYAIIAAALISHTVQWPLYRFWDFDRRRFTLRPDAERQFPLGD